MSPDVQRRGEPELCVMNVAVAAEPGRALVRNIERGLASVEAHSPGAVSR